MTEAPDTATPVYRSGRPGLIGCGIVHLLFGLMFVGFAVLWVVAFLVAPGIPMTTIPVRMVIYTGLFYLALAPLFATLGVGSMMARRWAPPLILVTSWGWLICGLVTAGVTLMLPPMMESLPASQAGAKADMGGCMSIGIGIFGIVLPLVWILFYRSAHVKATVQQLDPVPRWTDGQPISLLIFASWMLFGAVSVLMSSFIYKALAFGRFILRGWPAFAVMAAMATLLFWIGWGTLHRRQSAWWSAVVMLVIGVAWSVAFLTLTDLMLMYAEMGMPLDPQQAAIATALHSSPFFHGWMALIWTGYLVFLLYLRRYFFVRSKRSAI